MNNWMPKLLMFLLVVLAAMTICAVIPWNVPDEEPVPVATLTPVRIEPTVMISLPASTATFALEPTSTFTPEPTATSTPGATLGPTAAPGSLVMLPGSPDYLPAFPHMDAGCAWAGVAGQVRTASGDGIASAVVVISGMVNGQIIEGMALAGSTDTYGPGGYEIDLSRYLTLGGAAVQIQVFDLNGLSLSEPVTFNLPSDCSENLALISYQSGDTANNFSLPVGQ